jgi:hypothetical protein
MAAIVKPLMPITSFSPRLSITGPQTRYGDAGVHVATSSGVESVLLCWHGH